MVLFSTLLVAFTNVLFQSNNSVKLLLTRHFGHVYPAGAVLGGRVDACRSRQAT